MCIANSAFGIHEHLLQGGSDTSVNILIEN